MFDPDDDDDLIIPPNVLDDLAGITNVDKEAILHRQIMNLASQTGIKPEVLQYLFTTHKASLPLCSRCKVRNTASYYGAHCKECADFLNQKTSTICWLCDEIFPVLNFSLEKHKDKILCPTCYNDKMYQRNLQAPWTAILNNVGEEMLYIHFEKYTLKIPSPTGFDRDVDFVSLSFSSNSINAVVAGNGFDKMKEMTAMIKKIPVADREQDKLLNGTWIWTIPAKQFELFKSMWVALKYTDDWMFKEHPYPKLRLFCEYGISYGETPKIPGRISSIEEAAEHAEKAEDFFYNNAAVVSTEMPLEQVRKKLEDLLGAVIPNDSTEFKKTYRRAAMRYHPDRNNGDGSKMSELNFLYQSYIKIAGVQV